MAEAYKPDVPEQYKPQANKQQGQQMEAMGNMLQQQAQAQYKQAQGNAIAQHQKNIRDLQVAYGKAVQEGRMSVRDAQEQFANNKKQIDERAFQDTQRTKAVAEQRGIGNSQQMMGMQASDNSRKNSLLNENMTTRDQRINQIKDRIKNVTMQRDLNYADANSQLMQNVNNAQQSAQQGLNQNLFNLANQDYQMNKQQQMQMNQMGLQQYYNMMNQDSQNAFNAEQAYKDRNWQAQQAQAQRQFQEEQATQAFQREMEMMDDQQQHDFDKMAKAYGYDLDKMSVQQKYQLQQMAKSFDYDMSKMSKQQQYQLEQMSTAHNFDLEKMDVQQRNQLEQMAKAFGYDLTKMSKQQQYDLAQMAQQYTNNWNLNEQSFGHQSSLSEQSYNQAIKKAEKQSELAMKEEAIAYDRATERELAKYEPGTSEYRIAKERRAREKSEYLDKKQSDFMFDALASTLFSGEDVNKDNVSKAIKSYKNYLDMAGVGDNPKKSNTILDDWNKRFGVSSSMGKRSAPVAGASTNHQGVDFKMPSNTSVPSVVAGTVISAGKDSESSYGNAVRIKDSKGNVHIYAHMNGVNVKKGDRISVGQTIGKSGNTGRSSGAHLHYEVRKGNTYGNAYNPFHYFK